MPQGFQPQTRAYEICDPRAPTLPRYVGFGVGAQPWADRWALRNECGSRLAQWFRELDAHGLSPIESTRWLPRWQLENHDAKRLSRLRIRQIAEWTGTWPDIPQWLLIEHFRKPRAPYSSWIPVVRLLRNGKRERFASISKAARARGWTFEAIATVGVGSTFARMTAPTCEDEWRKRLTSIAMAAEPAVLLDNLSGKLKSATLDAALTSTSWSDRLLGRNETVKVPLATIFLGTGNNLLLHADTCRRTCVVRIETQLEQPETRTDCRYQPLLPHVRAYRGKLTAAALSLLHHYHEAGRPDQSLKPWGSFEGWTLIRNALVWSGLPDPADTLPELQKQNDTDTPILEMLLDGWQEAGGCLTAKEAIEATYAVENHRPKFPKLLAAIDELEGRDKRQSLGTVLSRFKGCRLNGRYFAKVEGRTAKWEVRT